MANNDDFMAELRPGAWIKVFIPGPSAGSKAGSSASSLISFWHHGIVSDVSGTGVKVIHFCRPEGSKAGTPREVCETSLDCFLNGGRDEQLVDAEPAFTDEEVVKRARKYIGAKRYRLPTRNCEHFASWCFKGSAFSKQVFAFGAGAGVLSILLGGIAIAAMKMARSPWV